MRFGCSQTARRFVGCLGNLKKRKFGYAKGLPSRPTS